MKDNNKNKWRLLQAAANKILPSNRWVYFIRAEDVDSFRGELFASQSLFQLGPWIPAIFKKGKTDCYEVIVHGANPNCASFDCVQRS